MRLLYKLHLRDSFHSSFNFILLGLDIKLELSTFQLILKLEGVTKKEKITWVI